MKKTTNDGPSLTSAQKDEVKELIAATSLNEFQRSQVRILIWTAMATVAVALLGFAYWFIGITTTQQVEKPVRDMRTSADSIVTELKRKATRFDSLSIVMKERIDSTAKPLIGMLSDFGSGAYYIGRFKGSILEKEPHTRIVDISHEIPAYNVEEGSWTLFNAAKTFPAGSIFVAIVNPGSNVLNARLVVTDTPRYYFIGASQKVFDYPGSWFRVHECYRVNFVVGDDIFGTKTYVPIIVHLLNRDPIEELKQDKLIDSIPLNYKPKVQKFKKENDVVSGQICAIDRWGNLQTNIPDTVFETNNEYLVKIGRKKHRVPVVQFYEDGKKFPAFLIKQDGWIQIARFKLPAKTRFPKAKVGEDVTIYLRPK